MIEKINIRLLILTLFLIDFAYLLVITNWALTVKTFPKVLFLTVAFVYVIYQITKFKSMVDDIKKEKDLRNKCLSIFYAIACYTYCISYIYAVFSFIDNLYI